MKTALRIQGEQLLQTTENTLREALLKILPEVAQSGRPIFFNSQFNVHDFSLQRLLEHGEAFFQDAQKCVDLRRRLEMPVEGTIGQLFLASCAEASSNDPQRRGPRRLASSLLEQLRHAV